MTGIFSIIKENLENSREDMIGNKALTNELIVDDLMLELGYNKKRDKSVKRMYKGNIDWLVQDLEDESKKLVVKTFAVGEEFHYVEETGILKKLLPEKVLAVMFTNGEILKIYIYNHLDNNYKLIVDINIVETEDEKIENLVYTISKENLSKQSICELIESDYITREKTYSWLNKNKSDILNILCKSEKIDDKDRLDSVLSEILNDASSKELDELKVSNKELSITISKLKTELEEQKEKNKEIELLGNNRVSDTMIQDSIELAQLKEEHTRVLDELEQLKIKNLSLSCEIDRLTEENNNTKNSKETKVNEGDLNEEQLKQISGLTIQNQSLLSEIESLNNRIRDKDTEIEELNKDKDILTDNIIALKEEINGLSDKNVSDYISQITNLTEELYIIQQEKYNLEEKVKNLNTSLDTLEGSERKKALELLELIQADENSGKQYVAVVNTKLFKSDNLTKFIGQSLQEMSLLKGNIAAPVIFDGDMFELEKHKVAGEELRRDLRIGESIYQINTGDMSDTEAINKLRIMFSNFDDLIFECKIVGEEFIKTITEEDNLQEDELDTQEKYDEATEMETTKDDDDTEVNLEEQSFESAEDLDTFDTFHNYEDTIEPSDLMENTEKQDVNEPEDNEVNEEYFEEYTETEDVESFDTFEGDTEDKEQNNNFELDSINEDNGLDIQPVKSVVVNLNKEPLDVEVHNTDDISYSLMRISLADISTMINNDETIINGVKYIQYESQTYLTEQNTFDDNFIKCIESVIAIEASKYNGTILKELKMLDMSKLSPNIKISDGVTGSRITATRYSISGLMSGKEVLILLTVLCNTLNIDTSNIYINVLASTTSKYILDNFITDESYIRLNNIINTDVFDKSSTGIAIIKGDLLNNTIITEKSLDIHSKLIMYSDFVKSKIMSQQLQDYQNFVDTVAIIITDAMTRGINQDIICKALTLDGRHKLISTNQDEVRAGSKSIYVNAVEYFVSRLDYWEMTESIIRIHTTIYNTTSIAVRAYINKDILDFINREFNTSEPSLALAVLTFRNYIHSVLK